MQQEDKREQILHLWQVEKLSIRQIAQELHVCRKRIRAIIEGTNEAAKPLKKTGILDQYAQLIGHWYSQHPKLKAVQIYERLKEYNYTGSYVSVARESREYRRPKQTAYYPLTFVPGEEAQVDWFFYNDERLGMMAGFIYVLAYSRYAWGVFYPKHSFEFFLSGHVECFKHIGGLAHRHRYDNCKSVVIKRKPEIVYNGQFLDFARFYGFTLHVCNPYSGNEKGRVERVIRDIRVFLYGKIFKDLFDLNNQFHGWLTKRNETIHRVTGKTPKELLGQERLIALPAREYPIYRIEHARASKTAFVDFERNKYSLPTTCVGKRVEVMAYVDHIEICIDGHTVARHKRSFEKNKEIKNPLHEQKLLEYSGSFKMKRILDLIRRMDDVFNAFIENQDDEDSQKETAYQIFILLKTHSKVMLISAVRELNAMRSFRIKSLLSLLNVPSPKEGQPLWPQQKDLLNMTYTERKLNDYDPDTKDMGRA
jgi:transposase